MSRPPIETAGGVRAHLLAASIDAQLALEAFREARVGAAMCSVERCAATLQAIAHAALDDELLEVTPLRPDDTLVVRLGDVTSQQAAEIAHQVIRALPGRKALIVLGEQTTIEVRPRP